MKKSLYRFFLAWLGLLLALSGCGRAGLQNPLPLASAAQNHVTVTVRLERDASGETWLAATFSPDDPGYHLYSKNLPRGGQDGLGRPTLLELTAGSPLQALGELSESVPAEAKPGPEGVTVYPAGPVTLRLPVRLPPGKDWVETQVSVTYMACSDGACMPPVMNKLIPVRIPGEENFGS